MLNILYKTFYSILGVVVFIIILGGILNLTGHPVYYNSTESLPQKFFIAKKVHSEIKKGDYIVLSHKGERHLKLVAGVAEDTVSVWENVVVFVGGKYVGRFYQETENLKMTITPIEGVFIIPEGFLYVTGTHPKSYDSRYKEYGLVSLEDVIGTACPIF